MAEETGGGKWLPAVGGAEACLYRAAEECGWPVTQTAVADAARVTPVTVRARVEEIEAVLAEQAE